MNASTKFIVSICIILVLVYYLIISKEGWIPWVWNIPTRDIYPNYYYDIRDGPDVRPIPLINPMMRYYRDAPYYSNHPFFREASFTGVYYPYSVYPYIYPINNDLQFLP